MAELAAWYQKKIGNYDKQEWETAIEDRITHGRHFPPKSTRLRPDLIDVDLIRGSSFPKAKPLQGSWKVMRLALARVLFLPFWTHWWTVHTSLFAARLFFALWILQLFNTILYFMAPSSVNLDISCILVPFSLMMGLGIVHSFIVSTAHQHSNNLRCLSLNHDRRRQSIFTSGQSTEEAYRSSNNTTTSDVFNSDKSESVTKKETRSTQTIPVEAEVDNQKWQNFHLPKLSLTPPPNNCVKFKVSPLLLKNRETSGDEDSPIRNPKGRRVGRVSTEDDGFESLNGNNSNGSDNGDDSFINNHLESDNEILNLNDEVKKDVEVKDNLEFWKNNSNGNTVRFRKPLCSDGGSSTNLSGEQFRESDDRYTINWYKLIEQNGTRTDMRARKSRKERGSHITSSSDDECEASAGVSSQHGDFINPSHGEEYSYCSEPDESDLEGLEGDSAWEPFDILNPASDRVSCTIWENGHVLKNQMSVLDISHTIVKRADQVLNRSDGTQWPSTIIATLLAALLPTVRLLQILVDIGSDQVTIWELPVIFLTNSPINLICSAFGSSIWERSINLFSTLLRLGLGTLIFFLLTVAQRSFNQRFLYAKLFLHLTSARRARQSSLPHFRLNRVRNIKAWLSVRSYLMRRGPQRSVDIIVSAAFVLLLVLISFLVVDLLQEQSQCDLPRTAETLGWAVALGTVLLRLVALGTRASRKQRCLPVLLTEQINLHLAMERRPASKDQLSVANNVLKLAADLLKELDSPFKIPGLSGNPYLYTITKVVVLSALSGVLSDLLGFKLKLHKIKIK